MTTGYQIKEQDQLYYITLQVVDWIDIFTKEVYRKIIIENKEYPSTDFLFIFIHEYLLKGTTFLA